jgi:hypothetical protein
MLDAGERYQFVRGAFRDQSLKCAKILLEAGMVSQPVTKEFIYRQLDTLPTDALAEVAQFIEFLQFRGQQSLKSLALGEHAAFGIWADYPEAKDPVAFASKLRQDMEKRQNG